MKKKAILIITCICVAVLIFGGLAWNSNARNYVRNLSYAISRNSQMASVASTSNTNSSFTYTFSTPGVLNEAGSIDETASPYWWVNSGGKLISENGIGSTIIGALPSTDKWYQEYARNNPLDTDGGQHPQNIFRLVTVGQWNNFTQEAHFLIVNDNFSASPNRNESNGLFLFNRYALGGQTLYYTGIRVDGTAVIKKKYHGTYYTMAQKLIFPGSYPDYQTNIDLLPHNQWIGLRSTTVTNSDGSVTVTLSIENPGQTTWTQVLQAIDTGQYGSTPPIVGAGHAGIRTDFMDVEFLNFSLVPS